MPTADVAVEQSENWKVIVTNLLHGTCAFTIFAFSQTIEKVTF